MKTASFSEASRRTRARLISGAGDCGSGFVDGRCERNAWWEESGRACTVTVARGGGMSAAGEEFGGVNSEGPCGDPVSANGGKCVTAP